jgi:hypothetical protein
MELIFGALVAVPTFLLVAIGVLFLSDLIGKLPNFATIGLAFLPSVLGGVGFVWFLFSSIDGSYSLFDGWWIWSSVLVFVFSPFVAKSIVYDYIQDQNLSRQIANLNNDLAVELREALLADLEKAEILQAMEAGKLNLAVDLAFREFAYALSAGTVSKEIKTNFRAIQKLQLIHGVVQTLSNNPENLSADKSGKELQEAIIQVQQGLWNSNLASSLHFEMVAREATRLDYGFFKDDPKYGNESDNQSEKYVRFETSGSIQVRGERIIVGCNFYQITSKTKVKVRQYFDEDSVETVEVKIQGNRWALELESSGPDVFEVTTKEENRLQEDWVAYKTQLNDFVKAVTQVQTALKVVADQKRKADDKKQTERKNTGAKFGDWVAIQPLASGSFGQVWLAEKDVLGEAGPRQQAALKVFLQSDFQSLKQFQAEMSSLGQLRHPNIAQLIDNARSGNVYWFATTYAGQDSLGGLISGGKGIELHRLESYATQLFAALAHAHRRDIVHGDVHPGNLVLTNDRSAIVLVDFGLSAIGGYRTQEVLTHRDFRAPELLSDEPQVDLKNDVFSAAVTILTLALGHTPWTSRDPDALKLEMKRGAPSLVGLDESLARFILPLLSPDPTKRPTAERIFNHLTRHGFYPW